MSKTSTINFSDFRWGLVDRRIIMQAGVDYRKKAFLNANNVFMTKNLALVPRPGTTMIKEFDQEIRFIPFSRGHNSTYGVVFKDFGLEVFYVNQNGQLDQAALADANSVLIPTTINSNSYSVPNEGTYTISAGTNANAYKIFTNAGYTGTDIKEITITFPTPRTIYALNVLTGNVAKMDVYLTHADGSTVGTSATPVTDGSNRFVMPSGEDYNNVTQIRLRTYIRAYPSGGGLNPTIRAPSIRPTNPGIGPGYVYVTGGYLQKLEILGTYTTQIAELQTQLSISTIQAMDYDQNNSYIFFAHQSTTPYYLDIREFSYDQSQSKWAPHAFEFGPLNAQFGSAYDWQSMGFPGRVVCAQSRLWFAAMQYTPTTIIASQIAQDYEGFRNFTPKVIEGQALSPDSSLHFTPIEMSNGINWIVGGDSLAVGSWDGTYKMFYGDGGVISATGAAIKQQNQDAAADIRPTWKDGKMVFVGAAKNNLRMMDYNMYVARQDSFNISEFHTELLSRIVKKIITKHDASNNVYVLFEDGTAAELHFLDDHNRGYFPFYIAGAVIKDINVVKSDSGDRLYLTCYYQDEDKWRILLMDEMEYPIYPVDTGEDLPEYQETVAAWVANKAPLDCKSIVSNAIDFIPDYGSRTQLYVSQLIISNPPNKPGLVEKYGPYVRLLNNPINGQTWDKLVGKTLFFEDDTGWDFYITIANFNGFIFGIPGRPNDPHWKRNIYQQDGITYAATAATGYIGIQDIPLKYKAKSLHIFSAREYLGEFSGMNVDGIYKTSIHLEEPVAQVVYGIGYDIFFDIGNVNNIEGMAKRRISLVNFNTFASWGLAVGTESTSQLVQLFNPQSTNGLIPLPMNSWTAVRLEDEYNTEKTVRVQQTLPYPFEIMGIQMVIEENNTETGV